MDCLVEPTLDLKWKSLKAESLGYTLKLNAPVDVSITNKLCENKFYKKFGCLGDIPTSFSHENIVRYDEEINKKYSSSSTSIKKNIRGGCRLLKEQYVHLHSVYVKEDNELSKVYVQLV